jgi:hypothetical protein
MDELPQDSIHLSELLNDTSLYSMRVRSGRSYLEIAIDSVKDTREDKLNLMALLNNHGANVILFGRSAEVDLTEVETIAQVDVCYFRLSEVLPILDDLGVDRAHVMSAFNPKVYRSEG